MSFESRLNTYVGNYADFTITYMTDGGTKVVRNPQIPYLWGAKNTPSQISGAVVGEPTNYNGDILKANSVLEAWMNSNKSDTAVDCSGLAYYVLNEASLGDVMNEFGKTYAWGVLAADLTSTVKGTLKTTAKDIVPGCTIRFDGGAHILVVYDVDKNTSGEVIKVKYAHSNYDEGPHYGYVIIGNEDQDLDGSSQTWYDIAYSNTTAKNFYDHTILLDCL